MAFTEAERHTIDDLYKREFKDMTPEEVQLYGRWCAETAAEKKELEVREEAFYKEMTARAELYTAQANESRAAFEKLVAETKEKWGENGQQE